MFKFGHLGRSVIWDGGHLGLHQGGLALDYPSAIIRKNQIKKKGRKFENSINSKNNQVLNSNYCCCKYSTFSIKKSKYSRIISDFLRSSFFTEISRKYSKIFEHCLLGEGSDLMGVACLHVSVTWTGV